MCKGYLFLLVLFSFTANAQNRITTGTVRKEFVWSDLDTVESVIEYAFFNPARNKAEIAVNREILLRHELWVDDTSRLSAPLNRDLFKKLLDDFYKIATSEPDPYNTPWQLEMATHITRYRNFVQLTISGFEYAGGIHGNSTFEASIFSRKDGHRMQLQDFFSDVNAVTAIFEKKFRELMELGPDDALNEHEFWFRNNVFALNDNFFLQENQFVVYYNTYEISSYAMGPIEIAVPLGDLKDYLILRF